MKMVVVGLGQCGGRIADEFARLNNRGRSHRGMEVITGAYAVNTDEADLSGLSTIKSDYQHRIVIGGRKTDGHGVGKINEIGADLAREDGDKVIEAVGTAPQFTEADALLLIAGCGGGTGSGSLPVITQMVKERYIDKPVFAIAVLPFEHEQHTEERAFYNTATCLKATFSVADAVFLVDNQRYVRKDASLTSNLSAINHQIVEPFYNMLSSGEEKNRKHIGAKVLDAGDIVATLEGWTVIGFGKADVPLIRSPLGRSKDFRKKSTETHKGIQAMDEALSELSLKVSPRDAGKALYLLCAPHRETNVEIMKELGEYLRDLAPDTLIRSGDYPRERGEVNVTVILSQLSEMEKVKDYYTRSEEYMRTIKKRQETIDVKVKGIVDAGKDIPSLL
ncbi:tubulin/FtsZ family protein [Chloroflexota bacterium]